MSSPSFYSFSVTSLSLPFCPHSFFLYLPSPSFSLSLESVLLFSFLVRVMWILLVSRQAAENFTETLHWLRAHRHPIDTRITKPLFVSVTASTWRRGWVSISIHPPAKFSAGVLHTVCALCATDTLGIWLSLTYCVLCYTSLKSSLIFDKLSISSLISCFVFLPYSAANSPFKLLLCCTNQVENIDCMFRSSSLRFSESATH